MSRLETKKRHIRGSVGGKRPGDDKNFKGRACRAARRDEHRKPIKQ